MYDERYNKEVNIYDVVKLLFEMKKDQHAERVLKLIEELKLLQGKLERVYEESAQSTSKLGDIL